MGIDFSKFSAEFKAIWNEAVKDKKISLDEQKKFSAQDRSIFMQMYKDSPQDFQGLSIEYVSQQKKDENGLQTLSMYSGKEANEGRLDLSNDTIKQYPEASFGYLKNGVVSLHNKSGEALKDAHGNDLKFYINAEKAESFSMKDWYLQHTKNFDPKILAAIDQLDNMDATDAINTDYLDLKDDLELEELRKKSEDKNLKSYERIDAKVEYKKVLAQKALKNAKQSLEEAFNSGNLSAEGVAIYETLSATFAQVDLALGITQVKESTKEAYGLNALADKMTDTVDDGDDKNLSYAENVVANIIGAGRGVDSFIGTQGLATIGALSAASEGAAAIGMAKTFSVLTQAYFAYEGATLVASGLEEAINATTKEEATNAGEKIGAGAIMLGGTAKSVKQGYRNIKIKQSDAHAQKFVKTANDQALVDEYNTRENYGVTVSLDIYKNELIKRGYKPNENGYFEDPKPTRPSTYRDELPTPDYSKTRENFPADAHQSLSKPGKATAYTTDGKPDGIVYQGKDGKMYVPNKWDPEHPYEVSTGADGKPASVIMIYDEAGGDFAVGDPTTIASTYKNPATGKLDPLYNAETGKANAMEIVKDQVPSAYKIVKPGTEIQTKEGPRVVQDGEIVVYDTDGDPYVMPKKNFIKRQEPLKGDAESEALYAKLKNGEAIPETEVATSGNATKPSAKTFTLKAAAEAQQKS